MTGVASEKDKSLMELFLECKDRYVYDPINKGIDFTGRRATDYKLNRSVKLPKPMSNELEFDCELRRREYLKIFREYDTSLKGGRVIKNKEKKRTNSHSKPCIKSNATSFPKGENEVTKNTKKISVRRSDNKDPINLEKKERQALKSLKKRIAEGELIIGQTDKSSRFAVMTRKQYLDAGKVHTNKDLKVGWQDVKYTQGQLNSHMWWVAKILGYGKRTDPERVLKNLQNHYLELPEMALLVKDHKAWSPDKGVPVPTRPVVSGNRGLNTHLSEAIAEILEPVALEMGSGEVSSTEEALALIDNLNIKIREGRDISSENVLDMLCLQNKFGLVESNIMEDDRIINGNSSAHNSILDQETCTNINSSIFQNYLQQSEGGKRSLVDTGDENLQLSEGEKRSLVDTKDENLHDEKNLHDAKNLQVEVVDEESCLIDEVPNLNDSDDEIVDLLVDLFENNNQVSRPENDLLGDLSENNNQVSRPENELITDGSVGDANLTKKKCCCSYRREKNKEKTKI